MTRALVLAALLPSLARADGARTLAQLFDVACRIVVAGHVSPREAARRIGRDQARKLGEKPDVLPTHPERTLRLLPQIASVREIDLDDSSDHRDGVDSVMIVFGSPPTLRALKRWFPDGEDTYPIMDTWGTTESVGERRGECDAGAVVPVQRTDDVRLEIVTVMRAKKAFRRD